MKPSLIFYNQHFYVVAHDLDSYLFIFLILLCIINLYNKYVIIKWESLWLMIINYLSEREAGMLYYKFSYVSEKIGWGTKLN